MAWADGVTARNVLKADPLTDSFAPTDSTLAMMTLRARPKDKINNEAVEDDDCIKEALSARMPYRGAVADSFAPTDSVSGLFRYLGQIGDSGSWSDLVSSTKINIGGATPLEYSNIGDSFNPTDAVSGLFSHRGSVGDSITWSDLVSATKIDVGAYLALSYPGIGDSFAPVDSVVALKRVFGSLSDSFAPSDTVLYSSSSSLPAEIRRIKAWTENSISVSGSISDYVTAKSYCTESVQTKAWVE